MGAQGVELGQRLERLTGEDASCCVPEYGALAARARESPTFRRSLDRARALADENRWLAVSLLRRRPELCACELQAALDVSHPTIHHHMQILIDAGLVHADRRGKWMYYRLTPAGRSGRL